MLYNKEEISQELKNGLCSIHETRPQDCRDYDCTDPKYPKPFTEVILKVTKVE
ncbi:hypothetical protein LCGC14_0641250 [marine sediment metagenome]|uniref:Uncharacterized protein n=1 Tax=marine sediment metagenome TaxID=412755 RepID=A0A0F9QYZ7_9ZZZZ